MESLELEMPATQFVHDNVLQPNVSSAVSEKFMVEDLLDFSNELEGEGVFDLGDDDLGFLDFGNSVVSSSVAAVADCRSNSPSGRGGGYANGGGGSVYPNFSSELCVPHVEVAEMEWLSNLMEEEFSGEDLNKLQLISGAKYAGSSETQSKISTTAIATADTLTITADCDPEKPVPGRARSKKSRSAPMNWESRLLLLPGTDKVTATLSESELLNPPSPPPKAVNLKIIKKKENHHTDSLMPAPDGRKCLHCATDKTPQWRTGPLGPKTLCNACGVRYKSGRLVPEYRPAASPTFVMTKHSNSHRKVLELRRQKEMFQQQQRQNNQQFVQRHHAAAIYEAAARGAGDEFFVHHHPHHLNPDFRQMIG